jgi:hypothetical protein
MGRIFCWNKIINITTITGHESTINDVFQDHLRYYVNMLKSPTTTSHNKSTKFGYVHKWPYIKGGNKN